MRQSVVAILFVMGICFIGYGVYPYFSDVERVFDKVVLGNYTVSLGGNRTYERYFNFQHLVEHYQTPDYRTYVHAPCITVKLNQSTIAETYDIWMDKIDLVSNDSMIFWRFSSEQITKIKLLSTEEKVVQMQVYYVKVWYRHGELVWLAFIPGLALLMTGFAFFSEQLVNTSKVEHDG